jgi:hypothetical protein
MLTDKGELFILLSPIWEKEWMKRTGYSTDLQFIIGFLTNDIKYKYFKGNRRGVEKQLELIADEFEKHYQSLVVFFEKENYKQALSDLDMYIEKHM